ncbi:hypothetical protein I350_04775 [Cryptococcus amylolentus CBS 6273]|uniref:Alpha/beta hydrolase fold-3 domain-containing protein n=1 Tax=Cryptococcus amylolentus CBS 6273 TaxID=1296118 RepID=A0A1E3JY02_9TREE|nr:hypothetical protein I350_04775 [Cryptococcus amylolentus CBS 6273]
MAQNQNHHHRKHAHHPHASDSQPPYWALALRAKALRNAAVIGFQMHHYASPAAPSPTRTKWIDATLGDKQSKNTIRLDIYEPKVGGKGAKTGRPGMIVFHGGGFVLGHGTDDARWAAAANETLGAVVIAVSYRCAPENPFPVPVEDCASSIVHLAQNAKAYGVDPTKLFLSGFSAGGNLAFSSYLLLRSAAKWGYDLPCDPPSIRGIIVFYPLLDYSKSRPEKRDACANPEFTLAPSLTTLFDSSYLPPGIDLVDPRLSPGLVSDELLDTLPAVHMTLCEYDMLLAEGLDFQKRLEERGKVVSVRQVPGEKHAWDKPMPLYPKPSVKVEYDAALDVIKGYLSGNGSTSEFGSSIEVGI